MVFPRGTGTLSQLFQGTRGDYTRKAGNPLHSSLVMAPLAWLMRNGQQAVPRIRRRGEGDALDTIHPGDKANPGAARLLEVLDAPNDHYDGATLIAATIADLALNDNAYWLKIRNRLDGVVQLWWAPDAFMEPRRREDSGNFIDYYAYTVGGAEMQVAVEDVVHFRDGMDPENPMKGMPKMRAVLREVFTDNEAAAYTANMLKNMGVPGLIISPESVNGFADPIAEDIDELKQEIEQLTTGANRGRALVLKRPTRVDTIGFDPSKMNARDMRRVPEERMSGVIGVPAIVSSFGAGLDRSTFANMGEAREAAAEEGLVPKWQLMARTIRHQLLPDFEGDAAREMLVDFDTSEVRVMREDEDKKVDRAVKLVQAGVAEVAEGRAAAGLPVDDSHRVFLRTVNLVEVPAGQTMADVLAAESVATGATVQQPAKRKAAVTRAGQMRLGRALMRDYNHLAAKHARQVEPLFKQLAEHVAAAFDSHGKAAVAGLAKGAGDPDLTVIAQRVTTAAALTEWKRKHLQAELRKVWATTADQTAKTLSATVGIEIGEPDVYAETVLAKGGTAYELVGIEDQTRKAIMAALKEGRELGEGAADLERRIRSYVEAGGKEASVSARAMRIARTETKNAQRVSCLTGYQQAGITTVMALDDRLGHGDDDCVDRNGTVFSLADAEGEEDHPNGTLDWVPALEGD